MLLLAEGVSANLGAVPVILLSSVLKLSSVIREFCILIFSRFFRKEVLAGLWPYSDFLITVLLRRSCAPFVFLIPRAKARSPRDYLAFLYVLLNFIVLPLA